MGIFDRFKKQQLVEGRKSFNPFHFLSQNGWANVAAWQALRYYKELSAVSTAIDIVTDEIQSLDLTMYDAADDQHTTDSEIIKFMRRPNPEQTGAEFLKAASAYISICDEVFILAVGGNRNRAPAELYVVSPESVSEIVGSDGLVDSYMVRRRGMGTEFRRDEQRGVMRFYAAGDQELWHIRGFNPDGDSKRGFSRLNSIYYEIEQHLHASQHNLSLLKRGGRVTGALIADGVLDDDSFERLQEELQKFYAGAENAGRMFIGDGGVKFQEMGKSNRDMDFMALKTDVTIAMFNRLKIPLPLISRDTMTLANMGTAKLQLYDNAVLPLAWQLLSSLTLMLGPRFGLSEGQKLEIDPDSIPALQTRKNAELEQIKNMGILTINEIRARAGYESLEGADVLLAPATMVPVATDVFTGDNREEPLEKYIGQLRTVKNADGTPRYTADFIETVKSAYRGES